MITPEDFSSKEPHWPMMTKESGDLLLTEIAPRGNDLKIFTSFELRIKNINLRKKIVKISDK